MEYDASLTGIQEQIEDAITSLFRDRQPSSLYDPMFHLLKSGGKRIRPMLVALSCQSVGGDLEDCLHASAAIELLHTFTLVHDDIMDRDNLRRGQPTVHVQWDEPTAILAGDGLVTLAYQEFLKTRNPQLTPALERFTQGLMQVCEGQALDKAFEERGNVSLSEYLEMIAKKTSALLEVSCEIGGLLGGGTPEDVEMLRQFARGLGMAFQIQDDMLDVFADETVSGKSLASDIMEKKKTYLSIFFLENADSRQKERFLPFWGNQLLTRQDVLVIRELLKASGAWQAAHDAVSRYIEEAQDVLRQLPNGAARDQLMNFAIKIRDRLS